MKLQAAVPVAGTSSQTQTQTGTTQTQHTDRHTIQQGETLCGIQPSLKMLFPLGEYLDDIYCSSLFTALVLHEILEPLDSDLKDRALARLNAGAPGDDGLGTQGNTGGYIDGLALTLAFDDLTFAIERFDDLVVHIDINRA
jgi:hypothetical protein